MIYPYLTTSEPGIGGQLKAKPEDFFVEEMPLYLPCGEGQHVYVEIEKRGLSTHAAISKLAHALKISTGAIGYAGLKDAQAVTRQTLSINQVSPQAVEALDIPNIKILKVQLHRNKLRIGHLAGNRFVLKVRQVSSEALLIASRVLAILEEKGAPNYFGEQRFGNRNNTHRLGEMLVRGDAAEFVAEYLGRPQTHETREVQAARQLIDEKRWAEALAQWPPQLPNERRVLSAVVKSQGQPDSAPPALDRKLRSLFVSAFQSELFNELLSKRIDTLDRLEEGDVAYIHRNGAAFVVKDAAQEQPRADSFEISPAGPLFGPQLLLAEGQPGQREQALLAERTLSPNDFKVSGLKVRGARRPYRCKIAQAKAWWEDGLMLSFELAPGTYATTVMAEIMKNR